MSDPKVCRLCLSAENLIDVCNSEKSGLNADHLYRCILMCTGLNFLPEDRITKYACKACCDICLNFFTFRKLALANETALKRFHQHVSTNFPVDIDEIVELNSVLVKCPNLTLRKLPSDDKPHYNDSEQNDYAIHPTVFNILKTYNNIALPNEVLNKNLKPAVLLSKQWENDEVYQEDESPVALDSQFDSRSFDSETSSVCTDISSSNLLEVSKIEAYDLNWTPNMARRGKNKRKRGSPRKRKSSNPLAVDTQDASAQKRKRGRPKRSENLSGTADVQCKSVQKKSRGRQRKILSDMGTENDQKGDAEKIGSLTSNLSELTIEEMVNDQRLETNKKCNGVLAQPFSAKVLDIVKKEKNYVEWEPQWTTICKNRLEAGKTHITALSYRSSSVPLPDMIRNVVKWEP